MIIIHTYSTPQNRKQQHLINIMKSKNQILINRKINI